MVLLLATVLLATQSSELQACNTYKGLEVGVGIAGLASALLCFINREKITDYYIRLVYDENTIVVRTSQDASMPAGGKRKIFSSFDSHFGLIVSTFVALFSIGILFCRDQNIEPQQQEESDYSTPPSEKDSIEGKQLQVPGSNN